MSGLATLREPGVVALLRDAAKLLGGRRVGLVTHAAATLPDLSSPVPALLAAGVALTALFGPEHGLAGAAGAGDHVGDARDAATGLPIWSLYGPTKAPTAAMLADVDVLAVDLQDVGVRFYTYLSTLWHVLHAAAEQRRPVLVLDRPNPLGGAIEGPGVNAAQQSFVGIMSIPIRHGLTLGELARLIVARAGLDVELTVLPVAGWRRSDGFGAAPWVPTSPGIPQLATVAVYPGTCLLEGTNLSLGRGTALPFELCGAPWVNGAELAAAVNALALPGLRLRPTTWTPLADRFAGALCQGVQLHITDQQVFQPVRAGLALIQTLWRLYPADCQWQAAHFDRLIGDDTTRPALAAGAPPAALTAGWATFEAEFAQTRAAALLYP